MNDWFSTIAVSAVTLYLIYTYFSVSSKKNGKVRTTARRRVQNYPLNNVKQPEKLQYPLKGLRTGTNPALYTVNCC